VGGTDDRLAAPTGLGETSAMNADDTAYETGINVLGLFTALFRSVANLSL
jgi:hypothetical protein